MAVLIGPRQVGKTTSARESAGEHRYFSWDRQSDRVLISRGADAVAEALGLATLGQRTRIVVFDEIHKYRKWRAFLKGFFDVYGESVKVIVTGSARLGVFRRGGDSLMGRYFPYRMHPLSLGELTRTEVRETPVAPPARPDGEALERLLRFGGFPEPFIRGDTRFYNRWRRLRTELLFREDLRDLSLVQEVGQVQVLAELLANQAGSLVNYSTLANAVNVSVGTVRRWIALLEGLFYCFTIRPWFRNVPKSLRRQPKVYLWDWSLVNDAGARRENLVAGHLLKAVHFWTDIGLGDFELGFLRDKAKREVDFVIAKDGKPWFLVEVKSSGRRGLNPALSYYQEKTGAAHAFQLVFDLEHVDRDCFEAGAPLRVPATTLLTQLV
ncbi:MAG: ATP-binding protein [Deltaproteobacteria bacterium]|nr:ATP-binding protein [Deltaproteobacteria bacterium]